MENVKIVQLNVKVEAWVRYGVKAASVVLGIEQCEVVRASYMMYIASHSMERRMRIKQLAEKLMEKDGGAKEKVQEGVQETRKTPSE